MEILEKFRLTQIDTFAEQELLEKKRLDSSQTSYLLELQLETNRVKIQKFSGFQPRPKIEAPNLKVKSPEVNKQKVEADIKALKSNITKIEKLLDQKTQKYLTIKKNNPILSSPSSQNDEFDTSFADDQEFEVKLADYTKYVRKNTILDDKIKGCTDRNNHLKTIEATIQKLQDELDLQKERLTKEGKWIGVDTTYQPKELSFFYKEFIDEK
ncbi:hypothetical protein TVAG_471050 [Trichomonas vaginalis G3]|uniref:Uncharacterized protein n=1 Tax=Trichomonas vaginalis (strain ATCC PRA-98 / G3) TaxID=412133 RepID=A2F4R1_TRIV3|nr:hypothetical protein TVAGG3_0226140 [Trichomonas vaginalis G3]EAY00122.1 hypothetical protein TVAG_471050 [Trichomonas vaginalis G3]KAI5552281.1 hypothetical protein TVAGG3_0226140 [Trichomonas vaginalis G3]|eukprot:XP_001313051.1 hypothetical protein [Trichomonas vaginalis G3]